MRWRSCAARPLAKRRDFSIFVSLRAVANAVAATTAELLCPDDILISPTRVAAWLAR